MTKVGWGGILTGDVAVAEFILELSGASGASGGGEGRGKDESLLFLSRKTKERKN